MNRQEKGGTYVDGKRITCWYYGGVWLHYVIRENRISLYMHSSGEDAFDSLAYCANAVAKILYKRYPEICIIWNEHPHQRKRLIETIP